jgi:iron complex outermembrane receptor protein
VGNARLAPEYVHTFEGQLLFKRGAVTASTGLSYSLLLNKAEFVQIGLNPTAENIARIGSLSWESEVRYAFRDLLSVFASADVTRVVRNLGLSGYQEEIFGWHGVVYPPFVLRSGAHARLPGLPVRCSADVMYVSSRRASDQNALLNRGSYHLPAYVLLGASISLGELPLIGESKSTLWLSATNLLGAVGPDAGFAGIDYPLAPRTVFLHLRQEF